MRVVVLTNFITPNRRGLFEALGDRVELTVSLSTQMESDRQWSPDWGRVRVEVQRTVSILHRRTGPKGYRDQSYVHVPLDLLGRLIRLEPDVIVAGEMGPRTLVAALYALVRPRTGLIIWATLSSHTESARGRVRTAFRRRLLRRADRVIVNGDSGWRYVRSLGMPPSRISTIPYVVAPLPTDGYDRHRGQIASSRGRLLLVGQLIERKGIRQLIRQLPLVAALEFELLVVGSGDLESELRDACAVHQVRTTFSGFLDESGVGRLMASSGLLLFPTLGDEWGLVVNEALGAGLPVLGSIYSQAATELIVQGHNGWLFDPLSDADFAAALREVQALTDDERAIMSTNAQRSVVTLTPEYAANLIVEAVTAAFIQDRDASAATAASP